MSPLPVQQPLEFWTGGMVPAALRRCGRFADGWLPSSCTPSEVAAAKAVIDEAAAEAGRTISAEHFGVSIAYAGGSPVAGAASGPSPRFAAGVDPGQVVPGRHRRAACDARALPRGGLLQVRGPTDRASRARTPGGPSSARWPTASSISRHDPEPTCRDRVRRPRRPRAPGPHGRGGGQRDGLDQCSSRSSRRSTSPRRRGRSPSSGARPTTSPPVTWMPGKRSANGTVKPTTVGLQHAVRSRGWPGGSGTSGARCPRAGGSPRTTRVGAWWRMVPAGRRQPGGHRLAVAGGPLVCRFRRPVAGRRRSTPARPSVGRGHLSRSCVVRRSPARADRWPSAARPSPARFARSTRPRPAR